MRLLGAKIEAKQLAEQTGVPVAPWSGGPVETVEDGLRHAATIGYPLIIKSRSGGGGRGIRIVRSEAELADALERTQVEALRTFGDATIFMERLVEGGRHIEVQVIADRHGNVWAPGVRDCSVQRRNQKVIEESSSPALSPEQDASLRESAKALVKAAGYVNAGTVEFLYQPQEKLFTFLEVNTRLQVEHPVTEATTGLDIVKLQIHVADGGRLEGDEPAEFGHAVEARLNAEDADQDFAPAPGTVEFMRLPTGPGVRVDTGMSVGDVIPPTYDSMVAKIIAWGRDRPEALARLRVALRDTTVVLRGGTTTKSFLLALLDRPEVMAGTADTAWLDRTGVGGGADPDRHACRRPRAGGDRRLRRRGGAGADGLPRVGPGRAPSRRARRGPHGGARLPRAGLQADRRQGRPGPLPGRPRRRARRRGRGPAQCAREPAHRRRRAVLGRGQPRRHVPPGRGGRRHAPHHAGRGGCGPRAGPRCRRRRPGRGRGRGRGRSDDRRPREHEDGDGGAGAGHRRACARSWPW